MHNESIWICQETVWDTDIEAACPVPVEIMLGSWTFWYTSDIAIHRSWLCILKPQFAFCVYFCLLELFVATGVRVRSKHGVRFVDAPFCYFSSVGTSDTIRCSFLRYCLMPRQHGRTTTIEDQFKHDVRGRWYRLSTTGFVGIMCMCLMPQWYGWNPSFCSYLSFCQYLWNWSRD